jgi:hypothetical protein
MRLVANKSQVWMGRSSPEKILVCDPHADAKEVAGERCRRSRGCRTDGPIRRPERAGVNGSR